VLLKQGQDGIRSADAAKVVNSGEHVPVGIPLLFGLLRGSRVTPGAERSCRPGPSPTSPRHAACFRCATASVPLHSGAIFVSLPPPSTERWKQNFYAGDGIASGSRGSSPVLRDFPAESSLCSLRLTREQRERPRLRSAAERCPSRSGSTVHDAGFRSHPRQRGSFRLRRGTCPAKQDDAQRVGAVGMRVGYTVLRRIRAADSLYLLLQ